MSITQIADTNSNVVDLPRKIRIRRKRQGPSPWHVALLLLAISMAFMVGRLSSY